MSDDKDVVHENEYGALTRKKSTRYRFDDQRITTASQAEEARIAVIEAMFSSNPELVLRAIVRGWTVQRTCEENERTNEAA